MHIKIYLNYIINQIQIKILALLNTISTFNLKNFAFLKFRYLNWGMIWMIWVSWGKKEFKEQRNSRNDFFLIQYFTSTYVYFFIIIIFLHMHYFYSNVTVEETDSQRVGYTQGHTSRKWLSQGLKP